MRVGAGGCVDGSSRYIACSRGQYTNAENAVNAKNTVSAENTECTECRKRSEYKEYREHRECREYRKADMNPLTPTQVDGRETASAVLP